MDCNQYGLYYVLDILHYIIKFDSIYSHEFQVTIKDSEKFKEFSAEMVYIIIKRAQSY